MAAALLLLVPPIGLLVALASCARPRGARIPLRGQHVFITGGSSGIGLAMATAAAREGARVSILARAAISSATGQDVGVHQADVRDVAAVAHALEGAGPVDVLVCNHGVFIAQGGGERAGGWRGVGRQWPSTAFFGTPTARSRLKRRRRCPPRATTRPLLPLHLFLAHPLLLSPLARPKERQNLPISWGLVGGFVLHVVDLSSVCLRAARWVARRPPGARRSPRRIAPGSFTEAEDKEVHRSPCN